jgi:hypothetical protein
MWGIGVLGVCGAWRVVWEVRRAAWVMGRQVGQEEQVGRAEAGSVEQRVMVRRAAER